MVGADTATPSRARHMTRRTPMEPPRIAHHAQKSARNTVTACRVEAIMSVLGITPELRKTGSFRCEVDAGEVVDVRSRSGHSDVC